MGRHSVADRQPDPPVFTSTTNKLPNDLEYFALQFAANIPAFYAHFLPTCSCQDIASQSNVTSSSATTPSSATNHDRDPNGCGICWEPTMLDISRRCGNRRCDAVFCHTCWATDVYNKRDARVLVGDYEGPPADEGRPENWPYACPACRYVCPCLCDGCRRAELTVV